MYRRKYIRQCMDLHILCEKSFTLIELLIVVASIGILAAIAVSNFLNAQIRAKVSRVEAELHTCDSAITAYRLDHAYYPIYNNPKDLTPAPHFLPVSLTTPVAYLSSLFNEVFPARNAPEGVPEEHEFHYRDIRFTPVDTRCSIRPWKTIPGQCLSSRSVSRQRRHAAHIWLSYV
ncbi:MAG: hypothetical protein ABIH23_25265, partial [bacterium]